MCVRLLVAAAVDHGARVAEQDAVGGEHAVQVAHLHGDVVGIVDADGDADAESDGDVDNEYVFFVHNHADNDADANAVQHAKLIENEDHFTDYHKDNNTRTDAVVDPDANPDAFADNDDHPVGHLYVHPDAIKLAYANLYADCDSYDFANVHNDADLFADTFEFCKRDVFAFRNAIDNTDRNTDRNDDVVAVKSTNFLAIAIRFCN